ncbi:MAG TPA: pantoate--beta-alanine ligase [Gemmatimonadaceae bacterium]|nr:pantoate--beta-alanine ligase [Gemmatimonadaceae bacterium]
MSQSPVVARTIESVRSAIAAAAQARRDENPSARSAIGFVPTMGYLHDGHATLIRRAREECDVVVVSIFVNPTQFGPSEDFTTYPRDVDRDLALLAREHADVAFVPEVKELYPHGAMATLEPASVASPLEGARRPGHFKGVVTVVHKLFEAVRPHRAYFGEKDWQQLQVVRALVREYKMPIAVIGVPTIREPDDLAMSSRNVRLSAEERVSARCVPRALNAARAAFAGGETRPPALERAMRDVIAAEPAATLDYAVVVDAASLRSIQTATTDSRALIALRVGSVRLIDNMPLG